MNETKAIMTTEVITVGRRTPIYEALEILLENDITDISVVNDNITLVGIITEKDILKLLSVLENDSAIVEDFMTKVVVSFDQEEVLIAICECLIRNNFRSIPIASQGKLAGILSRKDIIRYIIDPIG